MPQAVAALVAAAAKIGTTKLLVGFAVAAAATALAVDASLRSLKRNSLKSDNDLRRESVVRSAVAPRNIVLGKTLVGGVLSYMNTGGVNNKDMWMVIAHAGHQVNDIKDMWMYDDFIGTTNINWNSGVQGGKYFINSTAYAAFYKELGTSDQTNVTALNAAFTDIGPEHRGRGVAYTVSKLTLDKESEKVFEAGAPQSLRALIEGAADVYDPRLDTSPGANPTNSSYQAYTTNPILLAAWLCTNAKVGAGISPTKIDWQVVADEADYCDVNVPTSYSNDSAKRFTCNGLLTTADDPADNIDDVLSACNGRRSIRAGKVHLRAGRFGTGTNLLTNGSFQENVNSWGLGVNGAVQGITTVVGSVYTVRVTLRESTYPTDSYQLAKSDNSNGSSPTDQSATYSGFDKSMYLTFTATATTSYICLNSTAAAASSFAWAAETGRLVDANGDTAAFSDAEAYLVTGTTIDESWLRGDVALQTSTPKKDRFNSARAFYVNRDENYTKVQALEVTNTAFISRDNGEKLYRSFELPMTDNEDEAQRILHKRIQQTDQQKVMRLPCNYKALKCAVHSFVKVTISELGFTSKIFRVVNWKLNDSENGVDLILREDDAAGYAEPDLDDYSVRDASGGVTVGVPEVPAPSSPVLTAKEGGNLIECTAPAISDYWDLLQYFAGATSSFGAASLIAEQRATAFFHKLDNGENRYYWVRAIKGAEVSTEVATTPSNSTAANSLAAAANTANYSQIVDDESYLNLFQGEVELQTEDGEPILDETGEPIRPQDPGDVALSVTTVKDTVASLETTIDNINASTSGIQTTIADLVSGVSSVFVQDTEPVPGVGGVADPIPDFSRWYKENENNKAHYWNGSAWVDFSDPRVGANEADITALEAALGDAESDIAANAAAILTLDAVVAGDTTGIVAIGSQVTALEAELTNIQDESGNIITLEDDTEMELELPGSIATAASSAINALDARVILTEGNITALASDVTSLESALTTAQGNIAANATAASGLSTRVTATEASLDSQADDITSLQSSIGTTNSNVSTNATAISGLGTRVTTAEGAISSQATSLTALTATVGGNTATLTEYGTAIDGVEARWAVLLDVNGRITGIEQSSTATEGKLAFIADQVSFVDPDNDENEAAPFAYSGGTLTLQNLVVNGSLVINGTVTTGKLASEAVTAFLAVESASILVALTNASWTEVDDITVNSTDADVVKITVQVQFGSVDNATFDFNEVGSRLVRGASTVIGPAKILSDRVVSGNGAGVDNQKYPRETYVFYDDNPAAGANTYNFQSKLELDETGSYAEVSALNYFAISAEVFKR